MSIPDEMVERAARALRGTPSFATAESLARVALKAALYGAELVEFHGPMMFPGANVDGDLYVEPGEYLVVKL